MLPLQVWAPISATKITNHATWRGLGDETVKNFKWLMIAHLPAITKMLLHTLKLAGYFTHPNPLGDARPSAAAYLVALAGYLESAPRQNQLNHPRSAADDKNQETPVK